MSILKYEFGDFFNQFTLIQYMGLENLLDYWKNSLIQDFVFLCCFFFGGGGNILFKGEGRYAAKRKPCRDQNVDQQSRSRSQQMQMLLKTSFLKWLEWNTY